MRQRACICGVVGCRLHRSRSPRKAYHGADHARRKAILAKVPRPWFCGRCGQIIQEWEPWDAGHIQPLGMGPEVRHEHMRCNRKHGAELKEWMRKQRT